MEQLLLAHGSACIYIYICVCVCVCVVRSSVSSGYSPAYKTTRGSVDGLPPKKVHRSSNTGATAASPQWQHLIERQSQEVNAKVDILDRAIHNSIVAISAADRPKPPSNSLRTSSLHHRATCSSGAPGPSEHISQFTCELFKLIPYRHSVHRLLGRLMAAGSILQPGHIAPARVHVCVCVLIDEAKPSHPVPPPPQGIIVCHLPC